MLSYLHKYHAGNFADLHKQLLLTEALGYLAKKNKPFRIIDTHGGEGYYSVSEAHIKNHHELQSGLAPLFEQSKGASPDSNTPTLLSTYLNLLKNWNPGNTLEKIPGSPLLFSHFLPKDSTLIICEKHPTVFAQLEANFFPKKPRLTILNSNGYDSIKAYLPPQEKRGLVFIDPSYEEKSEYEHIAKCLAQAIKRFARGSYIIWYPLLNNRPKDGIHWLIKQILDLPIDSLWQHEWHLAPGLNPATSGFHALQGSGLLCIHLPWQADLHFNSTIDWLNTHLFPGRKSKDIWLKQPD